MDGKVSETQDSVNVRIAKLLGWRVEWRNNAYYALIRPGGTEYEGDTREEYIALYGDSQSEAEAWQHAPDLEHSVDACLAALPEDYAVEIWQARDMLSPDDNYRARIVPIPFQYTTAIGVREFKATGATRAAALATAFEALLLATAKEDAG